MKGRIACLLIAACAAAPALAKTPLPGIVLVLDECPGDNRLADKGREDAFSAALTPLLTGAINQGIKAYGAYLKAASEPAVVDSIHAGSFYYAVDEHERLQLHARCILVATRAKRASGGSAETVAAGYQSVNYQYDAATGIETLSNPTDNSAALALKLKQLGYVDRMPAFLAVIDIENNFKTRIGRFVPRFVFLDHSLREKGSSKPRDVKLGIAMTSPQSDKPIAADVVEFSEISPGEMRRRNIKDPELGGLRVTGNWFALPESPKSLGDRVADQKTFNDAIVEEQNAADSSRSAVARLRGPNLPLQCSTTDRARSDLNTVNSELIDENTKKEADRDARLVAQLTHASNYYQACIRRGIAQAKLTKIGFRKGESFLPVDLVVTETEYRRRPVARFFGDLLGTDTVATGVTSALVNELDPATRKASDEKDNAADVAALSNFEDALLDARKAELEYANATDDKRALALLELQYKQRKANRAADASGVERPYPTAGVSP